MLKHIVFFKMKDRAQAETLVTMLSGLKETIGDIEQLEAGINIKEGDNAADVALYTSFKDEAALDRYRVHPEHQKVVAFIGEHCSARQFVDYLD